jgi:hypothetical protein
LKCKSTTVIDISGSPAIECIYEKYNSSTQQNDELPTVLFKHNEILYIAQLSTPSSDYPLWFDQILSTFKFVEQGTTPQISSNDLIQGWYWGMENQKKINTPTDWVYYEAGRDSCWHEPSTSCIFGLD